MTLEEAKNVIYANVIYACEKAGFSSSTITIVKDACDTVIAFADKANTSQTKRIKTLDYCDTCNHKGCENCIANNLDEYCVPSNYAPNDDTPQTNKVVKKKSTPIRDFMVNGKIKDESQKHCHRPNNAACHPEQGDMWCKGCDYWYANESQTERSE